MTNPLRQRITLFLEETALPDALTDSCESCFYFDGDAHGIKMHLRCDVQNALLCPKIQEALTEVRQMVVCRCGSAATRETAEQLGWVIPLKYGRPGQCLSCRKGNSILEIEKDDIAQTIMAEHAERPVSLIAKAIAKAAEALEADLTRREALEAAELVIRGHGNKQENRHE